MNKTRWEMDDGRCTICHAVGHVRYIDLYTVGSEGTQLCQSCQNEVNAFIHERMSAHGRIKRDAALARNKAKKTTQSTLEVTP